MRSRVLWFLYSLIFAVFLLEAGSRLILLFKSSRPLVYSSTQPPRPSRFEIPESLSAEPQVGSWQFSDLPVTIHEVSAFSIEDGLWLPVRQAKLEVKMTEHATGRVVRTISMHTDGRGRRTPSWHSERLRTAKSHIVTFGCSMTWGYGVADDEAYPSLLSRDSADFVTYNISAGGYGLGEILVRAQDYDGLDKVVPRQGVGIYALADFHMARFNNSVFSRGQNWRSNGIVVEEVAPGRFEAQGRLAAVRPLWFLFSSLWGSSGLAQLIGVDWPVNDQSRVDRFVRAIKQLRRVYWEKTSLANPFIVMLLPFRFDHRPLREALDREEILFLDYSQVPLHLILKAPINRPGEDHPGPEFHEKLAAAMSRDLKAYFFKN